MLMKKGQRKNEKEKDFVLCCRMKEIMIKYAESSANSEWVWDGMKINNNSMCVCHALYTSKASTSIWFAKCECHPLYHIHTQYFFSSDLKSIKLPSLCVLLLLGFDLSLVCALCSSSTVIKATILYHTHKQKAKLRENEKNLKEIRHIENMNEWECVSAQPQSSTLIIWRYLCNYAAFVPWKGLFITPNV